MPADAPGPIAAVRAELGAIDVSPSALRRFGLAVGGVLLAGVALWAWRHGWEVGKVGSVVAGAATALVVLGALAPTALRRIHLGWMAFALALGWVMTRVILTLAWALVFVPIGLFFKLTGRDALRRRPDPNAETYWQPREPSASPKERMERMF